MSSLCQISRFWNKNILVQTTKTCCYNNDRLMTENIGFFINHNAKNNENYVNLK
jgi:hypothetical protein